MGYSVIWVWLMPQSLAVNGTKDCWVHPGVQYEGGSNSPHRVHVMRVAVTNPKLDNAIRVVTHPSKTRQWKLLL